MSKRLSIFIFLLAVLVAFPIRGYAFDDADKQEDENLDVKEIIFEHLGDGYGWEVPFSHNYRIPLPCIVRAEDGRWLCFMSSGLTEIGTVDHYGGIKKELVPVLKHIEKDGRAYDFIIAHVSTHKDKIVQVFPLNSAEQAEVAKKAADMKSTGEADGGAAVVDGYVFFNGKYYREYRPLDFSITKNVLALFIAVLIVIVVTFSLVGYYRRKGDKAPRKGMGFMELLVDFIYYDTIKATLGDKTKKFAPYLMTCFFFILTMNLVGLIVIFPGGANLTGNIAVTMVLAVLTFIITNIFGTKHYWKEIFWPDVPIWLKCPLPIMQLIEVFGIFTKPAALCVRLFANMMGGHMIVITLTLLIFIFAAFGAAVAGGTVVVSILFSVFMLALDVLVSFIQAYVFTLLSALFISAAQEKGEEHHAKEDEGNPVLEEQDLRQLAEEKKTLGQFAAGVDVK